jgi:signal transduction histidine kinase
VLGVPRTASTRDRDGGLTGPVGRAACRRVVESLSGRIWAEPRDGGGSEFGFALPLA